MYKVGICGHFGGNNNFLDGQTVKIKTVTKELERQLEKKKIEQLDTYNWKKNPFSLIFKCFLLIKNCDNIIVLPAHNGLKVLIPLFSIFNKFFKRKLHYVVIGGWLYEYLQNKKYLVKYLKKFKGIYVETNGMKIKLKKLGFENIYIMSNFKELKKIDKKDLKKEKFKEFKFCTFSRVMEEKGVSDSIKLIEKLNKKGLRCKLDIYGQIGNNYKSTFIKLIEKNKEIVNYKGIINFNESVNVLKDYNCLLFLTKYEGEGFPGTLIDALHSALPVIATNWRYNSEIIIEGKTGFICDVGDFKKLENISENMILNKYDTYSIKKNCLNYADNFKGEKVIKVLINNL